MTKFNLTTKEGTKLKADGATQEHLSLIIAGIFNNIKLPDVGPTPSINTPKKATPVTTTTATAPTTLTRNVGKPNYSHDHNYSFVREDKNGNPTYRSEYDCPNCGDIGTRFIWASSDYMKCHKCSCQISVEPTMPEQTNGVPLHDKDGFFFFGDSFYDNQYKKEMEENAEGGAL